MQKSLLSFCTELELIEGIFFHSFYFSTESTPPMQCRSFICIGVRGNPPQTHTKGTRLFYQLSYWRKNAIEAFKTIKNTLGSSILLHYIYIPKSCYTASKHKIVKLSLPLHSTLSFVCLFFVVLICTFLGSSRGSARTVKLSSEKPTKSPTISMINIWSLYHAVYFHCKAAQPTAQVPRVFFVLWKWGLVCIHLPGSIFFPS